MSLSDEALGEFIYRNYVTVLRQRTGLLWFRTWERLTLPERDAWIKAAQAVLTRANSTKEDDDSFAPWSPWR
jgi:hypothetical protein